MNLESSISLAKASEKLLELGRPESAFALLRRVTPSVLTKDQLRQLKKYAEATSDLDLALSMTRHLIVKLKGAETEADKREYVDLIGSDMGALSILHNLPKTEDPIQPIKGRLMYLLHHSLPYMSNGYATRGHGLAAGMKAAGLDIVCITRPGYPLDIKRELTEAPPSETIEGVSYLRISEPKWTGPGRSRTFIMDAADAIELQIREHRPQAIMAASNYIAALPALIAARRCGIPMAYEVRGFWEITKVSRDPDVEKSMEHQLKVRIDAKLAAVADQVFTLSQTMRDELVRRKVPIDKIQLIPNCCDPEIFRPRARDIELAKQHNLPDGVPVIGYIGSFVAYEGLDDLTLCCAGLRKDGHEFRLVLVGASDGPVYERIRTIAQTEGLGDWLIMPGRVSHDQVEAWYSLIDIAPFPRKSLPVTELVTPLKPLEAMAMKKTVVISSVAAMVEMVQDGVTGLIFCKNSPQALAAVLSRLLKDPGIRCKLGQQARDFVKAERSWVKIGEIVQGWVEVQPNSKV